MTKSPWMGVLAVATTAPVPGQKGAEAGGASRPPEVRARLYLGGSGLFPLGSCPVTLLLSLSVFLHGVTLLALAAAIRRVAALALCLRRALGLHGLHTRDTPTSRFGL